MAQAEARITVARLRELLDYDPVGVFRWRQKPNKRTNVGAIAGEIGQWGHRRIQIAGHRYPARHLAWLYVHGIWPSGVLDHANGNPDDNAILNLRSATTSQNM